MEGPNTQSSEQQRRAAQQDPNNPLAVPSTPDQLDWQIMEPKVRKLIGDWSFELRESKLRRAQRKLDVDIDSLRIGSAQNPAQLNSDETLIPVRVIDENIRQENGTIATYLTQSERLAIFDNDEVPQEKREILEMSFTKKMTYSGFLRALFKCWDGGALHGWDAVEILYTTSKPANCSVEHIGHDMLIFSRDSKDIQGQEFLLRALDVTKVKLQEFEKKHGFDPAVIQSVIADIDAKNADTPKNVRIYKYFTKVEGVVYVGWCSLRGSEENGTQISDWLKKPELLDMGRRVQQEVVVEETSEMPSIDPTTGASISIPVARPVKKMQWVQPPEFQYPIRVYTYSETEEQCITDQKGRAFLDNPSQEAQTALYSLVINGSVRASNVYASLDQPSPTSNQVKRLDTTLEHGCVYDSKINFFHTDYPDPNLLRAADSLNNRKAQERGQTASAVINRDDSRKTAEELKQARGEQAQMGLVPIMNFSGFLRETLSVCWYVVQSQAEQGYVILVPMEVTTVGLGGIPQMQVVNDPAVISATYDVKPAGDTDVLRREEEVQRMFMMLPILQPTPVYPAFLMDLISMMLPKKASKYNKIIQQGLVDQAQQIAALSEMLKVAVTNPDGSIKPEFQQYAPQLQQVLGATQAGQQQAGTAPQGQPNAKPNTGNKAAA